MSSLNETSDLKDHYKKNPNINKKKPITKGKFNYRNRDEGKVILIALYLIQNKEIGDSKIDLLRDFYKRKNYFYNEIMKIFPWFKEFYEAETKRELTARNLTQLLHHMYSTPLKDKKGRNAGCRPGPSSLHILNQIKLRKLIEPVRKLIRDRIIITREDCHDLILKNIGRLK